MDKDIKIIGVSTIGSYPNWIMHTVGSMYNICDKIIIVNGGFDLSSIETLKSQKIIPLEIEKEQLKKIDIVNKIIQILPSHHTLQLLINDKTELLRGGNMTLSYRYAYKIAKDNDWKWNKVWLLKQDSDQCLSEDFTRQNLEDLANNSAQRRGFRFFMYSEYYRKWDECADLPHDVTNDGPLFFCNPKAFTVGQGSPCVGDQFPVYDMRSYHLRRIHAPYTTEWDYHFKRFLYHTYAPCTIGEHYLNKKFNGMPPLSMIWKDAEKQTESFLSGQGHKRTYFNNDERFPPDKPLIVKYGVLNYIKNNYPK